MNNFALIGHGRIGSTLTSLLIDAGFKPNWLMSSQNLGHYTCPIFPALPPEPDNADMIFLCVPDDKIASMALEMANLWGERLKGRYIFHMSGLLTSKILAPLVKHGAYVASLHPLQSVMQQQHDKNVFKGAFFTVEGSSEASAKAHEVVDALGATLLSIKEEDKILYHTAAVIASNHLVTLVSQAEDIFTGMGLERKHLLALIHGTLANITKHGRDALTGPVKRGDWATVNAHIKSLAGQYPDHLAPYLCMAHATARLCARDWPEHIQGPDKLVETPRLREHIAHLKKRGLKIVFTNGCFDILHAGHVDYLSRARALGDYLILGLNADASVRRLKGPTRPVNDEHARAKVLAALECIDAISIFEEDTPFELISTVRPHILVKGGDWQLDNIVGSDIVKADGGEVLTIPFTDGFSTTATIEKLNA